MTDIKHLLAILMTLSVLLSVACFVMFLLIREYKPHYDKWLDEESEKIIEEAYDIGRRNRKPEIKLATRRFHYDGSVSLLYACYGVADTGYGKSPIEAYQNLKSMCYNKDTD